MLNIELPRDNFRGNFISLRSID